MAVGFALFVATALAIASGLFALFLTLAFVTHNAVRPSRDQVVVPEALEAGITGFLYTVANLCLLVPAGKIAAAVRGAMPDTLMVADALTSAAGLYGELFLIGLIVSLRHDLSISQTVCITITTWLYSLVLVFGTAAGIYFVTGEFAMTVN